MWDESQGNFASLSRRIESDENAHEASMADVRTMLERARAELGDAVADCRESCDTTVKDLRQELDVRLHQNMFSFSI